MRVSRILKQKWVIKMNRKILGMTAAIAVIVGLLMVNIPAEEKEKTKQDPAISNLERDRPSKVIEKYGLQKTPPAHRSKEIM